MSILVIAEHDNARLKPATLNTVTAAGKLEALKCPPTPPPFAT
jgi:hypothetical protein